jgi:hypothetical protein
VSGQDAERMSPLKRESEGFCLAGDRQWVAVSSALLKDVGTGYSHNGCLIETPLWPSRLLVMRSRSQIVDRVPEADLSGRTLLANCAGCRLHRYLIDGGLVQCS